MFWFQQDAPTLLRMKIKQAMGEQADRVVEEVPDGWTPRDGPIITVVADGPQRSAQATDQELVRVTVRSGVHSASRKIMTDIEAFFTTPGIHLLGFSISKSRGTKLISGPDSFFGGYFASRVYGVGTTRKVKNNGA
ncbi:hypothetical protein YH66_11810 [[Brevibacterium] flavum]|uniref:Uncharacterized protein n=2 Tax=Corynebacteriaceae TaxID=1653 RepID=A0A0F6SRL8_9CORY|nr:hypothetical protein YH66_11810 [[Brevibacterium] flavum]ANE09018.1 hypothetical protein A3654_11880 [Corynebacterium glutamicum]AST21429.1 hypothetical protein CEY17_11980 [Corynebacterium glutamicum ATCC 14067]KEI23957.1 hypothetical protein KIQ_015775 [Corynebacterium glutamicum ATCC 14067]KIH72981.1 hypothetical protein SD36_11865 [Corynebacterium glutamicum]